MNTLLLNYDNGFGDALCLYRGYYEYAKQRPDREYYLWTVDSLYKDAIERAPWLTSVEVVPKEEMLPTILTYGPRTVVADEHEGPFIGPFISGFDEVVIQFLSMGTAQRQPGGIQKGWGRHTFGVEVPDRKGYVAFDDEDRDAAAWALTNVGFRRNMFLVANVDTPTNPARSLPPEAWSQIFDVIPPDWGVIVPTKHPCDWVTELGAYNLTGHNIRTVAALMERCGLYIGLHGGLTHLAYAAGAKDIIFVNIHAKVPVDWMVIEGSETFSSPKAEGIDLNAVIAAVANKFSDGR